MPNTIDFNVSFDKPGRSGSIKDPQIFKILVLGDFTGSRSSHSSLSEQKLLNVDLDNLEERLQQLRPELDLSLPSDPESNIHIGFQELEDFHPDRIYDQVGVFQELRDLRKHLLDPATFAEAARQINAEEDPFVPERKDTANTANDSFSDLLGKPVTRNGPAIQHPGVAKLIRKFVNPHIVGEPNPEQDRLVESVDDAVSMQMREILHHNDFQALESTWRGLDFLVRELELGAELSISILDISKSQWSSEILENNLQVDSPLYTTLITEAGDIPGTKAWSLIVGLYNFEITDSRLLNSIGNLAGHAGTPFISGFSYRSQPTEPDTDWKLLQHSQAGTYIGLCTPGILLRLPYGENTDEIDRFEFEEMPEGPVHEYYLWGNAALACVALVGQSFNQGGGDLCPGSTAQLGGLPVHSYKIDGEYEMTPCGGRWISDSNAEQWAKQGIIPVLSVKNSDSVRVTGLHSLAGGPLLG